MSKKNKLKKECIKAAKKSLKVAALQDEPSWNHAFVELSYAWLEVMAANNR